mgnify:CR=1 FL=1
MKLKRMIGVLILILIFLSLIFAGQAQAATGSLWVKPESKRDSGYQYLGNTIPVWKFCSIFCGFVLSCAWAHSLTLTEEQQQMLEQVACIEKVSKM